MPSFVVDPDLVVRAFRFQTSRIPDATYATALVGVSANRFQLFTRPTEIGVINRTSEDGARRHECEARRGKKIVH